MQQATKRISSTCWKYRKDNDQFDLPDLWQTQNSILGTQSGRLHGSKCPHSKPAPPAGVLTGPLAGSCRCATASPFGHPGSSDLDRVPPPPPTWRPWRRRAHRGGTNLSSESEEPASRVDVFRTSATQSSRVGGRSTQQRETITSVRTGDGDPMVNS